jgi:secreted trypsin-like serine protease
MRQRAIAAMLAMLTGFGLPARSAVSEELTSRIVGGSPVQPGRWGALVSLQQADAGRDGHFCGGTVIDPAWVLTAAHCVVSRSGSVANANRLVVVEGATNLQQGGRRLRVARIMVHPDYRGSAPGQPGDIALLQLADRAQVEPQALAARSLASRVVRPGEMATVAGFGNIQPAMVAGTPQVVRPTGPQRPSDLMLQVNVPVVGSDTCRRSYGEAISDAHICAGFEQGGKDSCQGDSGGPLFMLAPSGRPVQVGVVSWGRGCAQPGLYGVYAAVGTFEGFIRQAVPGARFLSADPAPPPLVAAPAQGGTPRPPSQPLQQAATPAPGTPPGLVGQVSLDILPGERVALGDTITLRIRSGAEGTLMVFATDASGRTTQLFPNRQSAPNPSVFQAATRVKLGTIVAMPGPGDSFVLRARPPAGNNTIIAVVAPNGARVDELLARHADLAAIPDPDAFFSELGRILDDARERLAPIDFAPEEQIRQGLAIRPVRPPIPMAERQITIVERSP